MSTFQPVRRAARRAFMPSFPIASASWSSGTTTVASREDHLRALRARANLGDDGLDPRALLVTLAVHLLGARQQRLDLAEVDEDVVAVAGLLDDPGHDLADAVDVLVVHDLALRLANPLRDHLLRGLRGDAAEVLWCDVGA